MDIKLTIGGMVGEAEQRGCPLSKVVIDWEAAQQQVDPHELWEKMERYWEIMLNSIQSGLQSGMSSLSGLVGQEAALLADYLRQGKSLCGEGSALAAARAMGAAIVNAGMGKIVAAPTAGSCGILPAVLLTAANRLGLCPPDPVGSRAGTDRIISALFTASGFGMVIDENATTSGAKGGCQAECGAASCMAAAGAVELAGGTPRQAAHAGAIALKSVIGLACDPVAGLVEIPCVKRNAMGAVNALLAADMALAGIESKIPPDEVIAAMNEVGNIMPAVLRETAQGGLAATPTARALEEQLSRK